MRAPGGTWLQTPRQALAIELAGAAMVAAAFHCAEMTLGHRAASLPLPLPLPPALEPPNDLARSCPSSRPLLGPARKRRARLHRGQLVAGSVPGWPQPTWDSQAWIQC